MFEALVQGEKSKTLTVIDQKSKRRKESNPKGTINIISLGFYPKLSVKNQIGQENELPLQST